MIFWKFVILGTRKTSQNSGTFRPNSRTNSAQNTNTKMANFHSFPINQAMGGVVWSQNKKREKKDPLSFKIVVLLLNDKIVALFLFYTTRKLCK